MRARFYLQVFNELAVPLDKKWEDFSRKERNLVLTDLAIAASESIGDVMEPLLTKFEGVLDTLMRSFKTQNLKG